jgi:predicted metal-dependent HD superfamily phosphohydrolase
MNPCSRGRSVPSIHNGPKRRCLVYAHLSDEQWVAGRRAFIEKFLSRDYIFQTPWGRGLFGRNAVHNLTSELDMLDTCC